MDSIFKNTLRSELEFQDIKVKELSLRAGISSRTLEGYLSSRGSIPPADVAVKIAKVLGVSVEYLVEGTNSKNEISSREIHLISNFKTLSEKEKIAVEKLINALK